MNTMKSSLGSNHMEMIRGCQLCADHLPYPPKPILQVARPARILIIGQAPGQKAHEVGKPWHDASGDRLRTWLKVDEGTFYGDSIAIMPMGFCYPGSGKSGDLPPRPECAPTWHAQLIATMSEVRLTLLIGRYAQQYYLPKSASTLTETVKNYHQSMPAYFPLPHPSPRNNRWLKKNSWFSNSVLPDLQANVATALEVA
jgi:uracil-DNA glycosylase